MSPDNDISDRIKVFSREKYGSSNEQKNGNEGTKDEPRKRKQKIIKNDKSILEQVTT